jgi:hypothetical protein
MVERYAAVLRIWMCYTSASLGASHEPNSDFEHKLTCEYSSALQSARTSGGWPKQLERIRSMASNICWVEPAGMQMRCATILESMCSSILEMRRLISKWMKLAS